MSHEKHDEASIESPRVAKVGIMANHVDGDMQLLDEHNKVQHIPIPTASPRDPLNWSSVRKFGVVFACCWFSIMSLALIGNVGPLLPQLIQSYAPPPELIAPTTVINLTTWPSAFTGVGNWIWIPAALLAGRRFALLVASIMCLFATVGAAESKNFAGHMTARIFQGLASGVTESLLPLILADISFVQHRGRLYAIYWTSQSILSSIFGISGPYLAASGGWRAYYKMFAGTCAAGLLFNFFFIPETRFARPPANIDGQIVITDAYGEQRTISEEEAVRLGVQNGEEVDMRTLSIADSLKVWNGASKESAILAVRSYVEMAKCLTSPGLLWTVAYSGIVLGVNIAFSLTYANNLIQNYGWKDSQTGLIQIATIPAGLLATVYSGYMMDFLAIRSARRNNGVHQPESRLPIIILPSLLVIMASVLYGYSLQYPEKFGNHWIAPVIFFAMMTFGFISSLITTTTFAVECCPRAPGPALVIAVGAKNLVAFGLSFGLTKIAFNPMNGVYTYGKVLASATAAVTVLAVPVYFFNPLWRAKLTGKLVA